MNEAITEFSIELYRELSNTGQNVFLSPYSVSAALMMVMLGAEGDAKLQIRKTLHLAGIFNFNIHEEYRKIHSYLTSKSGNGLQLRIANRIFSKLGLTLRDEFRRLSSQYYGSEMKLLDFGGDPEGSRSHINQWVEEQTETKIKNLIPAGGISPASLVVLANAIYFKGDWEMAFQCMDTQTATFHISSTESKMVEMMHMNRREWICGESQSLNCKMLQLPYKENKLSMLVILPNETDGVLSLEKTLSSGCLMQIRKSLLKRDAIVSIPRFKMESTFHLQKNLDKMGITDAFNMEKANFNGMFQGPMDSIVISEVIHKAYIEVNEEGTEAAAATAVIMAPGSCPQVPIPCFKFIADHPFMFLIQDNSSGTVLFIGKFVCPV